MLMHIMYSFQRKVRKGVKKLQAFKCRLGALLRAVSQLKVDLKFTTKFNSFREFAKEVKVQFIGHKLNFNFSQLMDELF